MISIITATYNSEETLRKTIESVINQSFTNWELIICDGGSTDKTLAIVKSYCDVRIKIASTKDVGIFDAYNKGLAAATGGVLGILNSDDHYAHSEVLRAISDAFGSDQDLDLVHGKVQYLSRKDKVSTTRLWRNNFSNILSFRDGFMPAHPTVYLRWTEKVREIRYDESRKYAGDFSYMLKLFSAHPVKIKFFDFIMVNMLDGGTADSNIWGKLRHWKELDEILRSHFGSGISIRFVIRKFLNRLKERAN